ncbi:MAG: PAS domain S-box protein [Candidatus Thiodiazotropha sp.]
MKGLPLTLQSRLFVLLLLAAAPVMVIQMLLLWQSHDQFNLDRRQEAASLVEALAALQDDFISRTRGYLERLAKTPAVSNPDAQSCTPFLQAFAGINTEYLNLALARSDGELVCSALPLSGRVTVADRHYMQMALTKKRFAIGNSQVDRVSKQSSIAFAYPIIDPVYGRVNGVVIATVSFDTWSRKLGEVSLPAGAQAFVVDANQIIIAHYPLNKRVLGLFSDTYGYETRQAGMDRGTVILSSTDVSGTESVHAYRTLRTEADKPSLTLGVTLPLATALETAGIGFWNGLLLSGLALMVLFGVMLWWLRHGVVRPLRQLLDYTKALGHGEVNSLPEVSGFSELRALESQILSMVETRFAVESELRTSEARFRQIAETIQEVFWVVTPDWKQVLYINPAYEYVWQRSVESLYRSPNSWLASVVQDDRQQVLDYITGLEGGDYTSIVFPLYRIERRDGTIRWISTKGFPAYDAEGKLASVVGIAEDVTERKQYEAELSEREAKYRLLVEHAEDLVVKFDTDGHLLFVSPSYCRTFGKSEHQLLGKAFMPLVHEEDQAATREAMKGLFYPPFSVYLEQRAMTARGWRWFGWSDTAVLNEDQQVIEIIGVGRDITQQKQAEFALRESETRYRDLVDNMSDGVAVYQRLGDTDDFIITNFNHAAERITGLSKDEVIGQLINVMFPGVEEFGLLATIRKVAKEGQSAGCPVSAYHDERIELWVENQVFKLPSGEVVAVFRDATKEHRSAEALKRSEEKFRGFFEDLSVGLVIADSQGVAQEVNKSFANMFAIEREQAIGRPLRDLLVSDEYNEIADRVDDLLSGRLERYRFQTRYNLEDKSRLTSDVAIGVLYDDEHEREFIYAITEDVTALETAQTERNRLQRELMRTYRLEALGRLADGIAHDFNNILGAITGFIELAASRLGTADVDKIRGYLEKSQENSERAKQLIKQLLIFSRGPESQSSSAHDIGQVVASSMEMVRSLLPSSISIEVDLSDKPFLVVCDPVQIEQVLLNLCINARDAMEGKGRIEVKLEWYLGRGERCVICPESVTGEWVSLSVENSGGGIPDLDMERIFEPFFTTKGREKGTGMGLSVVHGIVSGYGGHILVDSTPEKGSRFRILLPLYTPTPETEVTQIPSSPRGEDLPSTRGIKVLVVDDEPSMRQLFSEALANNGYEFLSAEDGEQALEQLEREDYSVDLIVTDQIMPRMTGLELVRELRERGYDLPVVLCSGCSELINDQVMQQLNIDSCLEKPVNLKELNGLLKRLLSRTRTPS